MSPIPLSMQFGVGSVAPGSAGGAEDEAKGSALGGGHGVLVTTAQGREGAPQPGLGVNLRECERGLVRCTKQLRQLVALQPTPFTRLASPGPTAAPTNRSGGPSSSAGAAGAAAFMGAPVGVSAGGSVEEGAEYDEDAKAIAALSTALDGYLGGGDLVPPQPVFTGEAGTGPSSAPVGARGSGSGGHGHGHGHHHSPEIVGSAEGTGQCALRYVWFWATKRKKLTSALAQVSLRPWALGLGPWALGLGPWALGLGPWALGFRLVWGEGRSERMRTQLFNRSREIAQCL
jgi:hypothetical protein